VVVKRFPAEAARLDAFADEARISGMLHHPNIVSVIDFGTMDERPFLVLEHVDGADLRQLEELAKKAGTSIPLDLALHVGSGVARALAYAHSAKDGSGRLLAVVHRDVSPSNILVSWDGVVKLTDFGIALGPRRAQRTAVGVVKGTLDYMAPEQLGLKTVDHRADIFALGCVLHRLLTGRSPIESASARESVALGAAVPLDEHLEPAVAAIIERATRTLKERRYASASELAEECEDLLHSIASRSASTTVKSWLEALHPKDEPRPSREGLGDLFDLDLVPDGPRQEVKRFRTVARQDHTAATMATRRSVDLPDPLIGTVLHGYRLQSLLARGSSSLVYRARHEALDLEYAVKVLRAENMDGSLKQRILREAKVTCRLNHPNLVRAIDCGETPDGRPFLTMELVEGRSLARVVNVEGPLALDRAARITRQIASGLAEAHKAGLVHRDLKPSNVILALAEEGEIAKVLDFGVARSLSRAYTQLTHRGEVIGTPGFWAPEQILDPASAGTPADMYALGATLYNMLGGKPPYGGEISEVIEAQLAGPPPPLPLTRDLGELALSLMQRDPALRPSAVQVVEAIGARRRSKSKRLPSGPIAAFLAAAVACAAAGSSAALLWTHRSREERTTVQNEVHVSPAAQPVAVERPEPEQEPPEEEPPEEPVAAAHKARAPIPKTAEKPSLPRLQAELARLLLEHGLSVDDLEAMPSVADALSQWRSAVRLADANGAASALQDLRGRLLAAPIDAPVVQSKLKRISKRLDSIAPTVSDARVKELEARYFDLRTRFRPSLRGAELEALARDVHRMERDLDAASASSP
jgi:serine/threonine-protein kinase